MRRSITWRIAAVLAVVALLVTRLAAVSVAADAPCDMPMAMMVGTPCDDEPVSGRGDHGGASASLACFAKCPMPVPMQAPIPRAGTVVTGKAVMPTGPSVLIGIGVPPPIHPPRV